MVDYISQTNLINGIPVPVDYSGDLDQVVVDQVVVDQVVAEDHDLPAPGPSGHADAPVGPSSVQKGTGASAGAPSHVEGLSPVNPPIDPLIDTDNIFARKPTDGPKAGKAGFDANGLQGGTGGKKGKPDHSASNQAAVATAAGGHGNAGHPA